MCDNIEGHNEYMKNLAEYWCGRFIEDKKHPDVVTSEEDPKYIREIKLYDMIDDIDMYGKNNYMKMNLDMAMNSKKITKWHKSEAWHTDSIMKWVNERNKIDASNINKHNLWARKFYTLLTIVWKLKANDGIHIIISEDDNIIWGVKGLTGLLKTIDILIPEIETTNLSYYKDGDDKLILRKYLDKLLLKDYLDKLKMELRKEGGIEKIVIEEIADWLSAFYQRVSDHYYKLWVNRHTYYNPKGDI